MSSEYAPQEDQLAKNYSSTKFVEMRWNYYGLGEKHQDLDELIITTLVTLGILPTKESPVVETGPAGGDMLGQLLVRKLVDFAIGIDKYEGVLKDALDLDVTPDELRGFIRKAKEGGWDVNIDEDSPAIQEKVASINERRLLIPGNASDLSEHNDGDTKLFLALYMFYHLSEEERRQTLGEIYRILHEEGVAIITTSGNQIDGKGNKDKLHNWEQLVGDLTASTAPPPMNEGFPGNKASKQLSGALPFVYCFEYTDEVVLKYGDTPADYTEAERRLDVYMDSLRSLKNQFQPEPPDKLFESVIESIIKPMIRQQMWEPEGYTDNICRIIYFCSKREQPELLQLPEDSDSKFKLIKNDQVA